MKFVYTVVFFGGINFLRTQKYGVLWVHGRIDDIVKSQMIMIYSSEWPRKVRILFSAAVVKSAHNQGRQVKEKG